MKIRKHFIKISAIMISAVMLFSALGATAMAAEQTPQGMIEENVTFEQAHSDMLYAMFEAMLNYDDYADISAYNLEYSQSNFQSIFDALRGVFPEIFYLDTLTIGNTYNVDYTYDYATETFYIKRITFVYSMERTEAMAKLAAFYAHADEYLALVDDSMDDFTKALVLHDALALGKNYQIQSATEYSSNYTFMVDGWGRCENYAECYAYLLAQVGIPSEIISSDDMGHEWMKLRLGGADYYYNIDLTWDDPSFSDGEHPDYVRHSYFLLSDAALQTATYDRDAHYGYTTDYPSADTAFDGSDTLHGHTKPFFYIDGTLYSLYEKNDKGYIASYNYLTDTFTDCLEIPDIWSAAQGGYWVGNYSSIAACDGLLYFNTPDAVYTYDPVTGEKKLFAEAGLSGMSLYGMYIRDGEVYGLAAEDPNRQRVSVDLGPVPDPYLLGDVNEDGVVNIADATMVQYHLAEYVTLTGNIAKAADFNLDGSITVNDVTAIQVYINL